MAAAISLTVPTLESTVESSTSDSTAGNISFAAFTSDSKTTTTATTISLYKESFSFVKLAVSTGIENRSSSTSTGYISILISRCSPATTVA